MKRSEAFDEQIVIDENSYMEEQRDWSVVFYVEDEGREPVREFLQSLDPKTQTRFSWSIDQLRVRTTQAREPRTRYLEGKRWEIREESGTNIYRIMYFFFTGRRIVFVHGFQKKTQETPRRESASISRTNRRASTPHTARRRNEALRPSLACGYARYRSSWTRPASGLRACGGFWRARCASSSG